MTRIFIARSLKFILLGW